MKRIIIYFFILFTSLSIFPFLTFAQCSDAGVCQLGYLDDREEQRLNISLSYKNGYSGKEDDISFHSFQLDAKYDLFIKSSIGFIIPYNLQSGPGGDVNGIGDLLLGWTQELFSNEISSLSASIGIKLATGDENKNPLRSQVYQPGLGSNDLIIAIDYNHNKIGFGLGYQLVGRRNDKEGIRLKRGDDLLVRTSYIIPFDEFT